MAKYMQWLGSFGDAAVSAMNSLRGTKTIKSDGTVSEGGSTGMSGYTIIEADSDEAALEKANSCPFLEVGGELEVSEMIKMPG